MGHPGVAITSHFGRRRKETLMAIHWTGRNDSKKKEVTGYRSLRGMHRPLARDNGPFFSSLSSLQSCSSVAAGLPVTVTVI